MLAYVSHPVWIIGKSLKFFVVKCTPLSNNFFTSGLCLSFFVPQGKLKFIQRKLQPKVRKNTLGTPTNFPSPWTE